MNIKRSNFGISIYPDDNERKYIKERFTQRIASKELMCYECNRLIHKNEPYIRDKFWYQPNRFSQGNYVRKTNFICKYCWKGEIPPIISNNWINKNRLKWKLQ